MSDCHNEYNGEGVIVTMNIMEIERIKLCIKINGQVSIEYLGQISDQIMC